MKLGVHASIAGGLHNAPEEAREEYDAQCLQIFTKNQRQWAAPELTEEDVASFQEALSSHGYTGADVFAHASYLINLANPKEEKRAQSVDALVVELERASRLGILGVCFHPGSHLVKGETFGLERITESLGMVLDRAPSDTLLMIEGTAGTGNNLGFEHEHLGIWMDAFPADRLGITLDTCHLFAAGHDLRPGAYEKTMEAMDQAFGLDRVHAWHLNDSEHPLGSKKDRHAAIGQGEIGVGAFACLVNDARWADTISSLETSPDSYARDLEVLQGLREENA
ncbi:MAG: deoxyribonuclease IV [Candidatus Thermoplasmatota archaeon]|nr:deoxyribonuclease IV [Candidatus Thermoplasmatota archaeon]